MNDEYRLAKENLLYAIAYELRDKLRDLGYVLEDRQFQKLLDFVEFEVL